MANPRYNKQVANQRNAMKKAKGGFILTQEQKRKSKGAKKEMRDIEQKKLQRDMKQMLRDRKPAMMKKGGKVLKPVNKAKNPGLAKLPTQVRNKMGYMKKGGMVKK